MSIATAAQPFVLGLAGGVAGGKSSFARALERLGLIVIDFDALVAEQLCAPMVIAALRERWGPGVVRADGSLDRAAIARRIFDDGRERWWLESLLHPLVWRPRTWAIELARQRGAPGVAYDAPLLFESGLDRECDAVAFIDTPEPVRIARARSRGWDDGEVARREAAQWPLSQKRLASRYVIFNDGDESALDARARAAVEDCLNRTREACGGPPPGSR